MSFTAMNNAHKIIRKHKNLKPAAKLVLHALAWRHNQETGRCNPSIEIISEDTGCSERAVRDGIRQLEKEGLIQTVHRTARTGRGKKNLTNRYRLKGGAESAGRVGQNLPPNKEVTRTREPSAFDDLAMSIESPLDEGRPSLSQKAERGGDDV